MSSDLWDDELQTTVPEADHAYGTDFLHRVDDRTAWLQRNKGNSICLMNHATSSDPSDYLNERPWASPFSAGIISLPYEVNPGLSKLRFSMYCRVSSHTYDETPASTHSPDWMTVRARLLGNDAVGSVDIDPVWVSVTPDSTPPVWGWVTWELDLDSGNWASDPSDGLIDTLVIEIQSTVRYLSAPEDSETGLIVLASPTTTTPARIIADDQPSFYAESSTPPYDSSNGANETTCAVIRDANEEFLGMWAHLKRRRGDNNIMWVYPRTIPAVTTLGQYAWKAEMSYLQWRSLTITEEYDDDTAVPAPEKLVKSPTYAGVPYLEATHLNTVNRRKQLVCAFPSGFLPDLESAWDNDNYRMRWPWVQGDAGLDEVFSQHGSCSHADFESLTFRPILSPFYYTATVKEDTDYVELQSKSIDGYVRLRATVEQLGTAGTWDEIGQEELYHRTRYVLTDTSGNIHHTLAVEKQFDITWSPDGSGFVYREGYLDSNTDYPILNSSYNTPTITIDTADLDAYRPFRCRLEVEVMDSDDETYGAEALDTDLFPGSLVNIRMYCLLVGLSVWSDS